MLSLNRIIAVMFGRLRLNIDQGIRSFETIWRTMGATMSRYDRVVPFRKAKTSNSLGLDRAFQELLNDRKRGLDDNFRPCKNSFDLAMSRDAVSDEFASDPELCKTFVFLLLLSHYCLLYGQDCDSNAGQTRTRLAAAGSLL